MTLWEHCRIFHRAVKELCYRMEKRYTIAMVLDAFLGAVIGYVPIYFSARLIDALYERRPLETLVLYVALTVGLVFGLRLLHTYVVSVKQISEENIYRKEQWGYSEKAMELSYASIEDPEVDRLRYRIQKESQTGYNLYYLHRLIEDFTREFTSVLASIALVSSFFVLPEISLLARLAMLGGVFLTLAVHIVCTNISQKINRGLWDNVDMNIWGEQFSDYVEDYGSGKDIRLFAMEDFLAEEAYRREFDYCRHTVEISCRQALLTIPGIVLENVLKYGVYACLIVAALAGGITVGSIAKYVSCIMLLLSALQRIAGDIPLWMENNHYLKRYFSYFDIPNEMYRGTLTVEKRDDNDYQVEFRDVSFRYPNTQEYALRHVNLKFKIGEKLAIVGQNGSGKTTFIKLLCRLYDPCEGEILLNGVNIQKYDYDEYLSIFSVVFQDFQLFDFRLGEVVASGRRFDAKKVRECLEKANFGERFRELPRGAETYLYKGFDQSGLEISGGEAQKIALARALYRDAPFILLDEPTAALDPISEYEVYSNFNSISGDKTAVYISHRLASCRFCDKIAVFDKGRIVQVGKHEELVRETDGKYHELWTAQAQYYAG